MAVSAMLVRPAPMARASWALIALALAAALSGAEVAYHLAGQFWGGACFTVVFLATVHAAVLVSVRSGADRTLPALIAVASLVPLERLLVLSAPTVPFLRLYPNALWVLPMGLAGAYAYRASWVPGPRPGLLNAPTGARRPALQAAVMLIGIQLGAIAALVVPYAGPRVLVYPDAAKWTGAALFAAAGGVEELVCRGALQRIAAYAAGHVGICASFLASAYLSVAWMGVIAAAPVVLLSAVTSIVVYRTRYLSGAVASHMALNLLLVILR